MYMDDDDVCFTDRTREIASRIPTNDGEITFASDHYYPAGANDAEFLTALRSLLQNSGEEMSDEVCSRNKFRWHEEPEEDVCPIEEFWDWLWSRR